MPPMTSNPTFVFFTLLLVLGCSSSLENEKLEVREVEGWPSVVIPNLGLVSGVAVNSHGQPVLFHRGPRKIKPYDSKLYNETGHFLLSHEGPIMEDTLVTLDPASGAPVSSWGKGIFFFPHGIAVDGEDNIWLTDIALHQVLKFAANSTSPELTLGQKFSPGSNWDQFCKPTAVIVAQNGDIYVADGYCNARILKFDSKGNFLNIFPDAQSEFKLDTPHSLAFLQESELLCIADRENHQIICLNTNFDAESFKFRLKIQKPSLGSIWAIANRGDLLFAVNGSLPFTKTSGFIIDPTTESLVASWNPVSDNFRYAHDIAISQDGGAMYVAEVGPSRIWKFEIKPAKR